MKSDVEWAFQRGYALVLEPTKLLLTHGRPRIDIALLVAKGPFQVEVFEDGMQFESVALADLELRNESGTVGKWLQEEESGQG